MSIQRRPAAEGTTRPEEAQARSQVGALCWREGKGGREVLLVTSRDTGRWVIPKGWPKSGLSGPETARREAWEEAGVRGRIGAECLGLYGYDKGMEDGTAIACMVSVWPLKVKALARDWPESRERRREWFPAAEAARVVAEAELQRILAAFAAGPAPAA